MPCDVLRGPWVHRIPEEHERDSWHHARLVEIATYAHRRRRALEHEKAAARAEIRGDLTGAHWHKVRAEGQLKRFETVANCGDDTLIVGCTHCGTERVRLKKRCCSRFFCWRCRKEAIRVYRGAFAPARRRAMDHARKRGLLRPSAPGGKWGERFLTLTVPHTGDVEADARELFRAWTEFLRRLSRWWEYDLLAEDLDARPEKRSRETRVVAELLARRLLKQVRSYVRVLEVTPAEDEKGHAHLHAWMLSPFVPQAVLSFIWARCLRPPWRKLLPFVGVERMPGITNTRFPSRQEKRLLGTFVSRRGAAGRRLVKVHRAVVDVRRVPRGKGAALELFKYLVKDAKWTADGELVRTAPDTFAQLYAAVDRRRTISAARGFWIGREVADCDCCGERAFGARLDDGHTPEERHAAASAARARARSGWTVEAVGDAPGDVGSWLRANVKKKPPPGM